MLGTPDCVSHYKGIGFSLREMGSHHWVFSHDLAYIFPGITLAAVLIIHSTTGEQEKQEDQGGGSSISGKKSDRR